MTKHRYFVAGIVVFCATGALLLARMSQTTQQTAANNDKAELGERMANAANAFLAALSPEQRKQATFAFDDKERINWHYIPRERKGVPLKGLEGEARKAFHRLVQSGLSDDGYTQAVNVRSLEEVLFLLEGGDRETRRQRRDPQKYYISVFGKPGPKGKWGWRVEGHHLSLNFTLVNGKVVSSTPEFFGANPALIDAGPKRKIRVLGPEEDIARQLLMLCDKQQEKLAWKSPKAPDDIRSRGTPQPSTDPAVGLPVGKMSTAQKKLMGLLITEYLKNMPAEISTKRRAAIMKAGIDKVYFAWWGSKEKNKRHAYRVQGPTFLIEYNNTQNDANHLHTVWRDTAGDFNIPVK